jgi:hypothetical protein
VSRGGRWVARTQALENRAFLRLLSEPDWLKRRRGESRAAHSERLTPMAEERDRHVRLSEAERWARGLPAWGWRDRRCGWDCQTWRR